jgi:regulator of sirC expression with transglutaminase-like and TPR domain
MKKNELKAILTLLEDPDKEIFEVVYKSLMDKGLDIIPDLEKAWEGSDNSFIQNRIEDIIHKIQLNFIHHGISNWIKDGASDLIEGAYLVARYQYPDLGLFEILNPIERIKHDAWLEINDKLTALEKVRILNHIIFDVHKFSANTTNYYSPQNSYINQVIFSKKGNPISLGIIYAAVAQKIGLPIYGFNLPKNFILAYKDEFSEILNPSSKNEDILFYINPFNRGSVLGRKEIDYFLKQQNITPNEIFYQSCSNVDIIQRLLLNLIYSYEKLGYQGKIKDLKDLLKISKLSGESL